MSRVGSQAAECGQRLMLRTLAMALVPMHGPPPDPVILAREAAGFYPFRFRQLSLLRSIRLGVYDHPMAFWDVVQPRHVRQAAAEYDELGQEEFLARYGFGRARAYLLIIDGKAYDSKAILGTAYRHATGEPLGPHDFSGGVSGAARVLRALGFEVRNTRDKKS